MSFYEELEKRSLLPLIYNNPFRKVIPKGGKEFVMAIQDIVDNHRGVYLDEDCDIDGYLSVLSLKSMFDALGHQYYDIPVHVYKRHGLGINVVSQMLNEHKYDYYIITDSSSNNEQLFNLFLSYPDVKCICIDHHKCTIDRDKYNGTNVLIINPKLDTLEKGSEVLTHNLSACAIISLLIECTVKMKYPDKYDNLRGAHWVYGYITLYSDSCPFSWYNVAFAKEVLESRYPYPPIVDLFMDNYSTLNKTFVAWKMNPRLNAVLRSEYFTLAYDIFYNTYAYQKDDLLRSIERIYQEGKSTVEILHSSAKIEKRDQLVIGYLPDKSRARNYTGLVASMLATTYNRPAMVLLRTSQNEYEGSVRDLYNRNLLDIFQTVMYAEGHQPAFGVRVDKDHLKDSVYVLDNLLKDVQVNNNGVILMDWSVYTSTDQSLKDDLHLMAEYNEYAGQGLPVAYAVFPIRASMRINYGAKVTHINWGGLDIVSFGKYVSVGDTVVVEPTYPGKLIIKNVHYKY